MHSLSKATQNLQAAVQLANKTAAEIAETYFIGSEHFIYAFLNMPKCEACKILTRAGVKKEKYEQLFLQNVDKKYQGRGLTPNTQKMFDRAVESAMSNGMLAGTVHMLYEILCVTTSFAVRLLNAFADVEGMRACALTAINATVYQHKNSGLDYETEYNPQDYMPKMTEDGGFASSTETSKPAAKPATMVETKEKTKEDTRQDMASLSDCGIDMTERAKRGKMDPVIGRKQETEKLVQVLSRRIKNNPVWWASRALGKARLSKGFVSLS